MTRRSTQCIAIIALAVSIALPGIVAAREPGAMPVDGGNAAANPAESTHGGDLTPLRGHEHVPGLLARPGTASTVSPLPATASVGSDGAPGWVHEEHLQLAVAVVVTCWLCTLLARPRQPLPGHEVQELVYTRLLGRQHRLAMLALLVTAVTFFGALVMAAQRVGP